MTFAPEYVNYVLTENFEDAKALFLAPLLAIHRAHLVMLVGCRACSPLPMRIGCVKRSTICRSNRFARRDYDGTYEDLFFYVERLLDRRVRRRGGGPAAHRPQPERHRHDDVPDATAGVRARV